MGKAPTHFLCLTHSEEVHSPAPSAFRNHLRIARAADTSLKALTAKDLIEMEYLGTMKTFSIQITDFSNDNSFFTQLTLTISGHTQIAQTRTSAILVLKHQEFKVGKNFW